MCSHEYSYLLFSCWISIMVIHQTAFIKPQRKKIIKKQIQCLILTQVIAALKMLRSMAFLKQPPQSGFSVSVLKGKPSKWPLQMPKMTLKLLHQCTGIFSATKLALATATLPTRRITRASPRSRALQNVFFLVLSSLMWDAWFQGGIRHCQPIISPYSLSSWILLFHLLKKYAITLD